MKLSKHITKITDFVNFFIDISVKEGFVAVDATCGNGNDTLRLLNRVRRKGKVYAFDIQKIAIENTIEKARESEFFSSLEIISDTHAHLDLYVKENIDFAVFNLGYLPKGDHSIITESKSTIEALEKIIKRLNQDGKVVLAIYTGHDGGKEEYDELYSYFKSIDQSDFNVIMTEFVNGKNNPPKLAVIEKKHEV